MTTRLLLGKAAIAAACFPVLIALFLGLTMLSAAMPNASIRAHLSADRDILYERRANNGRVIDADTECIGLSIGLHQTDAAPTGAFARAMLAESVLGCGDLDAVLDGAQSTSSRDYFRYWHGYLALARPLLAVMPYNDVRGLLFAACLVAYAALLWRIGRDFDAQTALAFALPFLVLNALGYWVVATKATTWLLAVGAAHYMTRPTTLSPPLAAFFIIGALTSFFDFLTAPAFIAAFSALVWLLYTTRRGQASLCSVAAIFMFWAAGYALLWVAKFVFADIALDRNIWADVIGAVANRLRGESDQVIGFWPGAAIVTNFEALKTYWALVALGLFVVAPIARKSGRAAAAQLMQRGRPALLIAAAPLIWLEILSNHSQIHAAFTQLNFAPAFIVAGLVLFQRSARLCSGG